MRRFDLLPILYIYDAWVCKRVKNGDRNKYMCIKFWKIGSCDTKYTWQHHLTL